LCGAALLFGCCRAILKANCYHGHGHDAPCNYDGSYYMLIFGGAQLFLSFIPDFHDMAWLSVVAAVMSFSYAFIGLGLGMANTIGICASPAFVVHSGHVRVVVCSQTFC
jgi:hypothetical protein